MSIAQLIEAMRKDAEVFFTECEVVAQRGFADAAAFARIDQSLTAVNQRLQYLLQMVGHGSLPAAPIESERARLSALETRVQEVRDMLKLY